jgi:pimeloyl-ACP methyl ester carboxylesterase
LGAGRLEREVDVADYISRFVTAQDGLRLHARDYGNSVAATSTVVCLPGLARTSADFDALARHLVATDPNRRILVLDYRGRGASDRDPNPDNYDLPVESEDILAVLTALGVGAAIFIGTSRGGLHTMILSAVRPALIRGAVLNDIGPVIEARGLLRIRGYVGKLPQPTSWSDAVDMLKRVAGAQFTDLADSDWDAYARLTFEEQDGRLVARYDPALMRNLEKLDLEAVPTLWPQFDGLKGVPVLVIRGANSDLLSEATVQAMLARHPDCASYVVPGQGHAPLLLDVPSIRRVEAFVVHCETEASGAWAVQRGLSMLS